MPPRPPMALRRFDRKRAIAIALALGAAGSLAPRRAEAIQLVSPAPWIVEDPNGNPQTFGPCGVGPSACYTPSGAVTTYIQGQQIAMEWVETVPTDGWFRIALSANRADLTDPAVSVDDGGLAYDAYVAPPEDPDAAPIGITTTALPVLADNIAPHAASDIPGVPFYYTWNMILPDSFTCERCTLQLIEFLTNHSDNLPNGNPDGYFSHHCAEITILPADAGVGPLGDQGAVSVDDEAGVPSPACQAVEAGATGDDGGGGGVVAEGGTPAGNDGGLRDASAVDASVVDDASAGESAEAGGSGNGVGSSAAGGGGCGCALVGASQAPVGACAVGLAAMTALFRWRRRTSRARQIRHARRFQ